VFAVLMSFVVLLWNFMLACIELNWIQVYLRRLCSFLLVVSCGLSFLLERSDVCSQHFPGSSCALDQGAMAMMAACILWFCDLLMASIWIKSSRAFFKPLQRRWPGRQRRRRDDSTDREDEDEELARAARYASAVKVYHPNDSHLQRISPTSGSADRASYQEQLPPASMSAAGTSLSGSSVAVSAAAASARGGGANDPTSKGRLLPKIPTSFSYAARNPDESAGASPPSKSTRISGRNRQQLQPQPSSNAKEEPESSSPRNVVTVDDNSSKEQLEVILDNIERHLHDDDK
jgi:hypothetical protein